MIAMGEALYFHSSGRGERAYRKMEFREKFPKAKEPKRLSEIFAERIVSKFKKDVLFLLVGERGAGKSYTLLYLALETAKEIARRVDKDENQWNKYFTFENVAVIQQEDLEKRMMNLKKYNVYILDDAGVGWDSRDFASRTNKRLNHILQVCRTANSCILISVPDPILIDKVPRTQVRYYGEVSEQLHEYNKSLVRIFRNIRLFREGKTLQQHIRIGTGIARRFIAEAPPEDLANQYDEIRHQQAMDVAKQFEPPPLPTNPEFTKVSATIICDRCGYSWASRVAHPKRCPSCDHKLR